MEPFSSSIDGIMTERPKTRIYWTPWKNRHRENKFVEFLQCHIEGEFVARPFKLNEAYLERKLDTSHLLSWLNADRLLPTAKRDQCIALVKAFPPQIRVATETSPISFDIVVERGSNTYYWEFHEQQHRCLKDSRMKFVHGPECEPISVPRFLQRLIRDVWRIDNYPNLTIVWFDWFEAQSGSYQPTIDAGFREYHVPGKFSFEAFCKPTSR
jgi:hypothetical protein